MNDNLYGYNSIDTDRLYGNLIDSLGYEEAFNQLWCAMPCDLQREYYQFLARMNDLPQLSELAEQEENEGEDE